MLRRSQEVRGTDVMVNAYPSDISLFLNVLRKRFLELSFFLYSVYTQFYLVIYSTLAHWWSMLMLNLLKSFSRRERGF